MRTLPALGAMLLAASTTAATAEPPRGIDARIEALRTRSGTPGMAVAIVEDGKVVLARGYGVRKLGSKAKVDADTLFMIGSTGKAFTVAALATLVDAGRVGWDDRVIDHLPAFRMYDPWVTREMTIRDLLVHRSGLGPGAGDLLMAPRGRLSRSEIVQRLAAIRPTTSFRSAYAYDNLLYIVAGALIEAVSKQSWEDFMRDHVLERGRFPNATADMMTQLNAPNRASPHARAKGPVRGLGAMQLLEERSRLGQAAAPAGLLAASANDLATWLRIQLAEGAMPGGGRLFSVAAAREMWKPVTPIPISRLPEPIAGVTPELQSYALGWEVRTYRGAKIVWHPGGLFGFTTVVVMIPERSVGFAIAVNSEEAEPRTGLMYELIDHYLGLPFVDWPTRFAVAQRSRLEAAAALLAKEDAAVADKAGPSLPLGRYAGRYVDPWYGALVIGSGDDGLTVDFTTTPQMTGRLTHYRFDTFVANFDDPNTEPAYLTFGLDRAGAVTRITAAPVSPLADFSFDYQDLLFAPEVRR